MGCTPAVLHLSPDCLTLWGVMVQVVWNAWLSTLGHAPMIDSTDFLHTLGADHAVKGVSEVLSNAAASPFGAHASAAVAGVSHVSSALHPLLL